MAEGENRMVENVQHIMSWGTVVGVNITPEELRRYIRGLMDI